MTRFRMESNAKKAQRQQWLARYESLLVEAVPALAGKVDWDTANYFYNRGSTATDAANIIATRWKDHDHD